MTDQPKLPNRQTPFSQAFREFIPTGWAPYSDVLPDPLPATAHTSARRDAISDQFRGDRLVIPAGDLKVRSNDTDYRYRPHSAFAYLTGLGADREPDSVLVLEPTDDGHDATLYFKPRAPRTDPEFYSDARYGEMWVGQRESLAEMEALTGISCAPIAQLPDALAKNADALGVLIVADADRQLTARLESQRAALGLDHSAADNQLSVALSELRLIKDPFEIEQMRAACDATADGFESVVASLPEAVNRGRGERWVEGVFGLHARHVGNAVGYDTIAASGDHANTLHWIGNDGELRPGDLLLLDAGVELDTLYTADVTRTLPVNGAFSPAQRKVYDAVLEAQEAGIAAAGRRRGVARPRHRRPPPALDGARHVASPRHRRARLRPGPQRELPQGDPASRHGAHGRTRALLQVIRPAGSRGVAWHRRPDRGRHPDHR